MTSTIHGTWIEALVGTGIIGSVLLALAYLTALGRAATTRWRVGLVLLLLIGVRSLTGETIELFGFTSLLFGWVCAALPNDRPVTMGAREDGSMALSRTIEGVGVQL
jgi:hypothetical protein